jgi:hypothetical protein
MKKLVVLLVVGLMPSVPGFASASSQVLFGDQSVAGYADNNSAGVAQAFQFKATTSGTTTDLELYVSSGTTATSVIAGVYDDAGGKPGKLLTSGSIPSPATSTWDDIPIGSVSLVGGSAYWIAVLGTGGTLNYQDTPGGSAASYVNSRSGLTALPATYSAGTEYNVSPVSAYVSGTVASSGALLGDAAVAPSADSNGAGTAQAFAYTASASGSTSDIEVYVSGGTTATKVSVGLYSDSGGKPGTLLTSGSTSSVNAQTWNDVSVGSVALTSGGRYWIALLGVGGQIDYQDTWGGSAASYVDSTSGLTSLPATYVPGNEYNASPASAYVNGVLGSAPPPAPPANTSVPVVSGQAVQGQSLSTSSGSWSGSPSSFGYQWQDCSSSGSGCSNIGGATGSSYVLQASDVGGTVRSVVTAVNSGGSASASSAVTAVIAAAAPPSSSGSVGAPGPAVTCTSTLNPGANVSSAVSSAAGGSVICLNAGSWGTVSISSSMNPSTPVTLAATPGQTVTLGSFSIDAQVQNLTIQGFHSSRFQVLDPSSGGITFQYNTVENVSKGIAFELYSAAHGNTTGMITGVAMVYNQIDHVGQCLADVYNQQDTTFSHNVCGPGIGLGATKSTDPGHYIETGGEDNMTVDNNAFLGPACSCAGSAGLHLNVMHDWGSSTNMNFSNNILWHDDAIGQALLFQSGHFDNVTINNNLSVDDPNSGATAYAFWSTDAHGLSFSNNTVVYSYWGNLMTISQVSQDYPAGTGENYTIKNNVMTNTADGSDMDYQECASGCVTANNVTDDASAPGPGSVTSWTPHWQTTGWTPSTPYIAPPAGYYQPTGLSFSAGYQGNIGP